MLIIQRAIVVITIGRHEGSKTRIERNASLELLIMTRWPGSFITLNACGTVVMECYSYDSESLRVIIDIVLRTLNGASLLTRFFKPFTPFGVVLGLLREEKVK